jgi:hypothetical protein
VYALQSPIFGTHSLYIARRPIVFKEWRDTRTFSNLKVLMVMYILITMITEIVFQLYRGVGLLIRRDIPPPIS